MKLYRLALSRYISDLTGTGARLYGGRWNDRGTPVIYTSESRALAALEYLVHTPLALIPDDLALMELGVPDDAEITEVDAVKLPPDWRTYPPTGATVVIGEGWAHSGETLLLKVPSAVVTGEFNYLINPAHPGFSRIVPGKPEPFGFDARLISVRS